MSDIQQLRQLVNQRLASAAEDVFGLVEISIAEYRNEVERSRREIIELKKEIEHLTAVNAALCSFRAGLCNECCLLLFTIKRCLD